MSKLNFGVLLFHNGELFVAQVIEYPDCEGKASTRVEALVLAEQAMAQRGQPSTQQLANVGQHVRRPATRRKVAAAKQMLIEKFGNLSNRDLAARIGVVERDAPVMLSMALGGYGSRRVRCAIAVALGSRPSVIWPDRSCKFMRDDDAEYWQLTAAIANADDRPLSDTDVYGSVIPPTENRLDYP